MPGARQFSALYKCLMNAANYNFCSLNDFWRYFGVYTDSIVTLSRDNSEAYFDDDRMWSLFPPVQMNPLHHNGKKTMMKKAYFLR